MQNYLESQGRCKSVHVHYSRFLNDTVGRIVKCVDDNKLKSPGTKLFQTVKAACHDPLLKVKLHFILTLANHLQSFLKLYQVDKPMMPFLVPDLLKPVKDLLACFVKRDVVDSLATCDCF